MAAGEERLISVDEEFIYPAVDLGLELTIDTGKYDIRRGQEDESRLWLTDKQADQAIDLQLLGTVDKLNSSQRVMSQLINKLRKSGAKVTDAGWGKLPNGTEGPKVFVISKVGGLTEHRLVFVFVQGESVYRFDFIRVSAGGEVVNLDGSELDHILAGLSFEFTDKRDVAVSAEDDPDIDALAVVMAEPSVTRVYSKGCAEISTGDVTQQICGVKLGTGFVVNNEGYVVSASDVVEWDVEEIVEAAAEFGDLGDSSDPVQLLLSRAKLHQQVLAGAAQVTAQTTEYVVERSGTVFYISPSGELLNFADQLTAELVTSDKGVSIVKVTEPPELIALSFDPTVNSEGLSLSALGYGRYSSDVGLFSSRASASLQPVIVKADGFSDYDSGLVGAPVAGEAGEVTGLLAGKGEFSIISIQTVAEVLAGAGVTNTQSEVGTDWELAIDSYQAGKYSSAVRLLSSVSNSSAKLPGIDQLVVFAQQQVDAGNDRSHFLADVPGFSGINDRDMQELMGSMAGILIIMLVSFGSFGYVMYWRFRSQRSIIAS